MNLIEEIENRIFNSIHENTNRDSEKKIRALLRSAIDSENGLKFGSLTNVQPAPDLQGYLEFNVKVTMNAGALRNAIQSLKSRGFDITKKEWDPKQSRLSSLFLDRSEGNIEATEDERARKKPHQLDYDMKLAQEATAPLRAAARAIMPSVLFNPIDFQGSTKGFVYIVFEGFVAATDIGVTPPDVPDTGRGSGTGGRGGKRKKKIKGVSSKAEPTVLEILDAMQLDVAEELTGASAIEHESNMFDENFIGGVVTQVSDLTTKPEIMNKYSHQIYKVIKSEEIRINSPSQWKSNIQSAIKDNGRFGGPGRRIPGRILQKNKQALYITVYVNIKQDRSRLGEKRPLPRGSIQYIFNIYAVTEDEN